MGTPPQILAASLLFKIERSPKKMILNTGSRTDIPAYYAPWFYNRIREGYVLARNPYYPSQVTRYRLTPKVIDILTFCTKNPQPILDRLQELS